MKCDITVYAGPRKIKMGKQTRERIEWVADAMDTLASSFKMLGSNSGHAESAATAIRKALDALDGMETAAAIAEAEFAKAK